MHSDHSPLRISWSRCIEEQVPRHVKLFRFEKNRLDDRRFNECIARSWSRTGAQCEERIQASKEALTLKEGDKNTKFFHKKASMRQKYNRVSKIKDENGDWVYGQKRVR
ncbi:hypothetical protein SESBI_07539 [Sesbania bispinosa]|nr:hypothetical protein SESBI_07539 [Sesbania bispinosa]